MLTYDGTDDDDDDVVGEGGEEEGGGGGLAVDLDVGGVGGGHVKGGDGGKGHPQAYHYDQLSTDNNNYSKKSFGTAI